MKASAVSDAEQSLLIGEAATMKVEASCMISDRLTYKWYRDSETEPIGSGPEFTTDVLDQIGDYRYSCVVDDGYGSVAKTVEFTVSTSYPRLIRAYTQTPEVSIAPNQTIILEVETECYGTPTLTYAWTLDDMPLGDAENAASYSIQAEAVSTSIEKIYKCAISDGTEAEPAIVTFTVKVDNALAVAAVGETEQVIIAGEVVMLGVEVSCLVGDKLTYQWYTMEDEVETPIAGAAEDGLTLDSLTSDTVVKCLVDNGYGSEAIPVVFNVIVIHPEVSIFLDGMAASESVNSLNDDTVIATWTVTEDLDVDYYHYKVMDASGTDIISLVQTDTADCVLDAENQKLEIGKVYTLQAGVALKNTTASMWSESIQFMWGFDADGFVLYKRTVISYKGMGETIDIPAKDGEGNDIIAIGPSAFKGLDTITSVSLPATLTTIGESAFEGCTGLELVKIPNCVSMIGKAAFKNCTKLNCMSTFG